MFITQITVYLENTQGTLRALTKTLAKENIDMLALAVADTANFGLVRIVTREKDCDRAFAALQENGFLARINHVFCLSVPNEPAGLDRVLEVIEENGIQIEYMYSFNHNLDGEALMIMRMSKDRNAKGHVARAADREVIAELLEKDGIMPVPQEKINTL